jgi:hypothetical protein
MAQLIIDADKVGINIREAFSWHDAAALSVVITDLDKKTKALAVTDAEAAAERKANIDAITAKYSESLSKLDSEFKSLSDSVAGEAEEAEMGIVETQQRARMAQIEAEKKRIEEQKAAELAANDETSDATIAAAKDVDSQLRIIFGKPMRIPIEWDLPPDPFTGSRPARGGDAAPAAMSAMASRASRVGATVAASVGGGGGGEWVAAPVLMDGLKVAEVVMRRQGQIADRYRVRR